MYLKEFKRCHKCSRMFTIDEKCCPVCGVKLFPYKFDTDNKPARYRLIKKKPKPPERPITSE